MKREHELMRERERERERERKFEREIQNRTLTQGKCPLGPLLIYWYQTSTFLYI